MQVAPETFARLLAAARRAQQNAYVPYSHFPVGAALLAKDGSVYAGCNVENASYGLTNCAERVAIGKAVSEGHQEFDAILIVAPKGKGAIPPCGACRQVLREFASGASVWLVGDAYEVHLTTVEELLPGAFERAALLPQTNSDPA